MIKTQRPNFWVQVVKWLAAWLPSDRKVAGSNHGLINDHKFITHNQQLVHCCQYSVTSQPYYAVLSVGVKQHSNHEKSQVKSTLFQNPSNQTPLHGTATIAEKKDNHVKLV
jgi:hypothetical protein